MITHPVNKLDENHEKNIGPAFGAIIGTVATFVAWLIFVLLYALDWSKGYNLFQDLIVTFVSFLVAGLVIGMIWLSWFRVNSKGNWNSDWNTPSQSQFRRRRAGVKEYLNLGQRAGEVVTVFIGLLILGFFLYHQYANTGFFTSKFGGLEMFAFYGSILLTFVPPLGRAAIGRRNPVRPIDAFSNLFSAVAALFLFYVFPFNFAHVARALPGAIQFTLTWVNDDIGRIVLILIFIGSLASGIYNIVRFATFPRVRDLQLLPSTPQPPPPVQSLPKYSCQLALFSTDSYHFRTVSSSANGLSTVVCTFPA